MDEKKIDEALMETFPASDVPAFVGGIGPRHAGVALEEFKLNPALQLNGVRVIRTAADALALLREHETRPGVDDRDEVLHQIERAKDAGEMAAALARFRAWATDWAITIPPQPQRGPDAA
jgi:hypothetical protein